MWRSFAIIGNELRLLRRDPAWLILMFVIPLILVGLMRGAIHFVLVLTGHPGASGAEFTVPAQAVTFVFYLPGLIGISFLREHGWATWVRLRTSGTSRTQILLGKIFPILVLGLLQMLFVFGIGKVAYGLRIRGSMSGVAHIVAALVVTVIALGLAITAVVWTMQQLNAIAEHRTGGTGCVGWSVGATGDASLVGAQRRPGDTPVLGHAWFQRAHPQWSRIWIGTASHLGFAGFCGGFTMVVTWDSGRLNRGSVRIARIMRQLESTEQFLDGISSVRVQVRAFWSYLWA